MTGSVASKLYVVGNGETRCALDDRGGGTCKDPKSINDGAAVATELCGTTIGPDRMRVTGLAPDGTKGVTVSYATGHSVDAPVA